MAADIKIGSEFWSIPTTERDNGLFPAHTRWYQSGRASMRAILSENRFRTAALPSWCCESMILPFLDAGIDVSFYPALQDVGELDADVVLVLDYFGFLRPFDIRTRGKIIRDLTQSVLSGPYDDADYYCGSLRKWAGFWTGGFAWARDGHALPAGQPDRTDYVALRREAMERRIRYNHTKDPADKTYSPLFKEADRVMDKSGYTEADPEDIGAARRLDVDLIRIRRRENASILLEAAGELALFPTLEASDVPLFVPVCVPDGRRDELHAFLRARGISCPRHWPVSPYHQLNAETSSIYAEEISLVCDQRYTAADMAYLAEALREYHGA